jgi:hypothetical protein
MEGKWSRCPPHLTGNSMEEDDDTWNLVILSADHSMNIHTFDLAIIMLWKVVDMRKPSSGVDNLLLERV